MDSKLQSHVTPSRPIFRPKSEVVDRIDDPLLRGFYLAFLVLFVLGYGAQVLWLRRQRSA